MKLSEGSPPRVRGKLYRRTIHLSVMRITPAGAGKTRLRILLHPGQEDHPRGCGENFGFVNIVWAHQGSPPRVRGKLLFGIIDARWHRITPAGAGKTQSCTTRQSCTSDHPRGCGENHLHKTLELTAIGSPPRVRGKLAELTNHFVSHRITPAGAGKTPVYYQSVRFYRDHPRGCGENLKRSLYTAI